jgi:hypothetical protein
VNSKEKNSEDYFQEFGLFCDFPKPENRIISGDVT